MEFRKIKSRLEEVIVCRVFRWECVLILATLLITSEYFIRPLTWMCANWISPLESGGILGQRGGRGPGHVTRCEAPIGWLLTNQRPGNGWQRREIEDGVGDSASWLGWSSAWPGKDDILWFKPVRWCLSVTIKMYWRTLRSIGSI